jgi:hypothetical protein
MSVHQLLTDSDFVSHWLIPGPSLLRTMSKLELFQELFYLDSESPSYLRWKIHINNRCKAHSVAGHLERAGYWRVTYKQLFYLFTQKITVKIRQSITLIDVHRITAHLI